MPKSWPSISINFAANISVIYIISLSIYKSTVSKMIKYFFDTHIDNNIVNGETLEIQWIFYEM